MSDLPTSSPLTSTTDGVEIRVVLARFEAKLDVALAQHGAKLEQHGAEIADHEARIRTQEARAYVTPKGLLAAMATAVALLGGFIAVIDRLTM